MGIKEGEEIPYKDTQIGKRILDAFTSELYDNCEYVLREYISNSIDAKSTKIDLYIDYDERDLMIMDTGIGMDKNEINECLDIMVSPKTKDKKTNFPPIGEIGIGIYSAGKICKDIIIRSKKKDEEYWHIRRIPIWQWMEDLKDPSKKYISDVIISFQKEVDTKDEEEKKYHGTIITLHEITPKKFREMLDPKFIFKLSRVVPVDFEDGLNNLSITDYNLNEDEEGKELLKENIYSILSGKKFGKIKVNDEIFIPLNYNYNEIQVHYRNLPDLKQTKNIMIKKPIPKDNILSPKYFFLAKDFKINNELVGAGWAVFRGSTEKIAAPQFSDYYFRGIIVRLYNVLIYNSNDVWEWAKTDKRSLKSHPLDNMWGEIYLFSEHLNPKSSRDSIISNDYWKKVREEIANWLVEVAEAGERQRKKAQAAKRYQNHYEELYEGLEKELEKFSIQINTSIIYKSAKEEFNKDPSNDNNFIGLIKCWMDVLEKFDDILKKYKLDLESSEILSVEEENELDEIKLFFNNLKTASKETLKTGPKSGDFDKTIKEFSRNIEQFVRKVDEIITKNKQIIKRNEEKKKIAEEIRIKRIYEQKKEIIDEKKKFLEEKRKQEEILREEEERLRKQRDLIEAEKKRLAEQQEELEKIKSKEIVEKKGFKTPSKNIELINEYEVIDGDLKDAKKLYMNNKSQNISDLVNLIPNDIFHSVDRMVILMEKIFSWILSNSTIDKEQLKQVIQNFV